MQHFRDNARSRLLDCKPAHLLSPLRPARALSSSAAVERFCATRINRCTHHLTSVVQAVAGSCAFCTAVTAEKASRLRRCDSRIPVTSAAVHPPRLALTLHPSHNAGLQPLQLRKSRFCARYCHLRHVQQNFVAFLTPGRLHLSTDMSDVWCPCRVRQET